ncbi:MAG: primosomal protein N' [Treponema sp.]|jgi:primosomal protein N' (replication factor Y)|nr:primosomal protein N' [Treponema sp.]
MTRYVEVLFNLPLNQSFNYETDSSQNACFGKRVVVPFNHRELTGFVVAERESVPASVAYTIKKVYRVIDSEPLFDARDYALAQWIASFYFCTVGQALATLMPSGRKIVPHIAAVDDTELNSSGLDLSEEQQYACDTIIHAQDSTMFYLYGITGSGKTEVFLHVASHCIANGKSVIYLVPEISLTYQTAEAIRQRFGDKAATLHSALTTSERFAQWLRIRRGEAPIVIGPRSAVFAPVQNLGLIIIDEEHDSSYKSSDTPRYHARQVAMHRCAVEHATLVMGSATPSVEAWKSMENGSIQRFTLTKRLSGGELPHVHIVNLNQATGCLSMTLKEEIRKTVAMGKQTILFLNRRGFTYHYRCTVCGYELVCKHCSVALTYHKSLGQAVCHYCGYRVEAPRICPVCGSLDAKYVGFGTELIEEEVRASFPHLRIIRIDADNADKRTVHATLNLFKAGMYDILLGTQMVAKGLNFPGVRLVGVVLADIGLYVPDFRASERTFSLLVQVAGRSGRFSPDGIVIVQTFRPTDPSIQSACALDAEGFFASELKHRQETSFPPYSRLIRFTARSSKSEWAFSALDTLAHILRPLMPQDADMLGPAECPIMLIARKYRWHLLLRGQTMKTLHTTARTALAQYSRQSDKRVYLEVDVDPVAIR